MESATPPSIAAVLGASGPMGISVVQALLQFHVTVIAPLKNALEAEILEAQTASIKTGKLVSYLTDHSDYDKVLNMASVIHEEYGNIDLFIYISEYTRISPFLSELEMTEWDRMINEDLAPYFICCRLYIDYMKHYKEGVLVHLVCKENFIDKPYSALANIAAVAQMEMDSHFAQEAAEGGIKFHHVVVDNNKAHPLAKQDSGGKALQLGSFVLNLYAKRRSVSENTFQKFCQT